MIEIVEPGPSATVQDLGRIGRAAVGVPRSGGFDRAALRAANRLVGNPDNAAVVECTFGGLRLRVERAVTVALTGAACAGAPDWGRAVTLPAGAEVSLGTPAVGLRSYLAVRGGLDVDPILGSRSTDTLSGLGPPALRPGSRLAVGTARGNPADGTWVAPAGVDAHRVVLGPRADWFTPAAAARLLEARWTVRDRSDRVGVRLDGPRLERAVDGELPSEPTVPGALQVPPDGRPIVFGPDAPVTGGYPVIAVLRDLDPIAQARPGDTVRFTTR
ncbi:biotin-dependent carboxyltransferase family protein [uncultured Jatrophihabitans sp.]|uniref:5-oxoprolinase subunit C family protein n=1 Tax=uncultured Jatrophihabitans sp. TaxID=1610747 RepID=UPI0035C9CEB8